MKGAVLGSECNVLGAGTLKPDRPTLGTSADTNLEAACTHLAPSAFESELKGFGQYKVPGLKPDRPTGHIGWCQVGSFTLHIWHLQGFSPLGIGQLGPSLLPFYILLPLFHSIYCNMEGAGLSPSPMGRVRESELQPHLAMLNATL